MVDETLNNFSTFLNDFGRVDGPRGLIHSTNPKGNVFDIRSKQQKRVRNLMFDPSSKSMTVSSPFNTVTFESLDETVRQMFGNSPNIHYYHYDDISTVNLRKYKKDKEEKEKNKNSNLEKMDQNLMELLHKSSPNPNMKRRRVFAYVWFKLDSPLGSENNGLVFYGGSVYTPSLSPRTIYNRRGEIQTARQRLLNKPVIMKTNAASHEEVERQIKKAVFSLGVKRGSIVTKNKQIKQKPQSPCSPVVVTNTIVKNDESSAQPNPNKKIFALDGVRGRQQEESVVVSSALKKRSGKWSSGQRATHPVQRGRFQEEFGGAPVSNW